MDLHILLFIYYILSIGTLLLAFLTLAYGIVRFIFRKAYQRRRWREQVYERLVNLECEHGDLRGKVKTIQNRLAKNK